MGFMEPCAPDVHGSDLEVGALVIADDLLPQPGIGGRAAGLRAWSIGEGLRANGVAVTYAVRTTWWDNAVHLPEPRPFERYWADVKDLTRLIRASRDRVLVNCSYPSLVPVESRDRLLIQDSHGPRLMEAMYRAPHRLQHLALGECFAYSSADYFVCAGERQLAYFYQWLALSGFDLTDTSRCFAVRFGYPGRPPVPIPEQGRMIFAGTLLPWTDPRPGWDAARGLLSHRSELVLMTGPGAGLGSVEHLTTALHDLAEHPRCSLKGLLTRDEYIAELCRASSALDVMARNCERELAFATRTAEYLWMGVPPITAGFSELGELVRNYDAGWVVDPQDASAVRVAVAEALHDPSACHAKAAGARRLHADKLAPALTAAPLADICRQGTKRTAGSKWSATAGVRARLACRLMQVARTIRRG